MINDFNGYYYPVTQEFVPPASQENPLEPPTVDPLLAAPELVQTATTQIFVNIVNVFTYPDAPSQISAPSSPSTSSSEEQLPMEKKLPPKKRFLLTYKDNESIKKIAQCCQKCFVEKTPMWREGPAGKKHYAMHAV